MKMNHLVARLRVRALGMATRLVPAPTPFMFTGPGSSTQLVRMIADRGARSALVVTDAVLLKLKVVDPVLVALEEAGIKAQVFSDVEPDPTIDVVMDGVARLRESRADAVLAVGGGSPIDAAKAMIACSAKGCSPDALNGYFRVRSAVAPFFAIPTTAGTGSEVTVVSVISDPAAKRKFAIVDNKLVPVAIALDPNLMIGLPPGVTAATGMDALTHAVESYLSTLGTPATRAMSLAATRAIVRDLPRVYEDGRDVAARQSLAVASCQAGLAFTKASVGYVHAISHQIGACYHLPHGHVNAVVLPYVLDFYLDAAARPIAELARACGLGGRRGRTHARSGVHRRDPPAEYANGYPRDTRLCRCHRHPGVGAPGARRGARYLSGPEVHVECRLPRRGRSGGRARPCGHSRINRAYIPKPRKTLRPKRGDRNAAQRTVVSSSGPHETGMPDGEIIAMEIPPEFTECLARQRAAYLTDPYPSVQRRRADLEALGRMLKDNETEIVLAINADFGVRSAVETRLLELFPVREGIRSAISAHW